ncbi:amino acid ABC transporter permease [Mesorhizobium sp.]|uniref:amino acid ABC transporter permease n=1 Tax=Mesorhizobium sp. TaxID=1871066 RepID=UPI000FE8EC23|nr:amino acid ABC transporter permease [Mesorhizobium sp.]RWB67641.1 MAG: amino acid ABC transporter permease [Mesorhizobium sp.]
MTAIPKPRLAAIATSQQETWIGQVIAAVRSRPLNTVVTIVVALFVAWMAWALLSWGAVNAVWGSDASSCAAQAGRGACWPVIAVKFRYILFGSYPFDEHWRPAIGIAAFVAATLISSRPVFWGRRLLVLWTGVLVLFFGLMFGGVPGLSFVSPDQWGGLPLTLTLSIVGVLAALPLGIGLALGRRSPIRSLRVTCALYIETIRGVPLITVLFMSSIMLPLFLPAGRVIGGLARAMIAIVLFTAAYVAEVIRGGLQMVPRGQFEAASSLGFGYWKTTYLIVLPQALRIVIPPLVNTFIEVFKDTTLVIIVGLFDLLNTTRASVLDIAWRPYYVEAYVFAGAIYFFFCFYMSHISLSLERRLAKSTRH